MLSRSSTLILGQFRNYYNTATKMVLAPTVKLNNGVEMPALGLGTYASTGGEGLRSVRDAIDAGYRHFDSAHLYANEAEVGQGIREKIAEGIVTREEIFFVTKLWNTFHRPDEVKQVFDESLANSGLEYIDLYLMHFPMAFEQKGADDMWPTNEDGSQAVDDSIDFVDTWRELEKLVKSGLVRSIGVSNFNSEQIDRLLAVADIKPVTNQVECSPTINQKELAAFCKERDIVLTAYSPLGNPNVEQKTPEFIFGDQVLAIAAKHNKSAAQIVLRYLFELGRVPIPKSVTKSRIEANIDIFDFQLTDEELAIMDSFNTGERLVKMSDCKHSKYYPFAIPF